MTSSPTPTGHPAGDPVGRALVRALVVVALANLLFFALMFLAQGDQCVILSRVRTAFETGDLTTRDFLLGDSRRGWFQFDDCNALQMLTNQDSSRVNRALAPRVYQDNEDWEGQCRVLRFLVEEWVDPKDLHQVRYTRYWHGYNVIPAFALRYMELRDLRRLLSASVWASIGLLALAAWRSGPRVRRTGLVLALTAATVWAVPYFAPGLTQGPGDALLLLGLAVIAARPGIATDLANVVAYAAAFGAATVFVEMLTGKLPTAIAWLVAMTLAAARDQGRPGRLTAPRAVFAAVGAFVLAALATSATKLVLAGALAEPQAGSDFAARLGLYMRAPHYEDYGPRWVLPFMANLPGLLLPFARLFLKTSMLTFGSNRAGYALVAATGLAWIAAAILGWRARNSQRGRDRLILLGAALVPAAWVCLLPTHTYIHATFMVRILVVPVSLATLALVWPTERTRDPGSTP